MALAAPPVSAANSIINPGQSIQEAINAASPGDTIFLNPGIYTQHDIAISRDITIRSNPEQNGNEKNTIIDGESAGRIFNNSAGAYSLTIQDIALRNGYAGSSEGGAVYLGPGATLNAYSATFFNCSAGTGGCIHNRGTMTIQYSTFGNCSAASGGAINNTGTIPSIYSSSFTRCSAPGGSATGEGGAILNAGTIGSITSSTFSYCSATGTTMSVGGAISSRGTIGSISATTFSSCSGWMGGAIANYPASIGSITASRFLGCTGGYGGAISNGGTISSITSTFFSGNSVMNKGGAIENYGQLPTLSLSTFENCSAMAGGAIYTRTSSVSISSAGFRNCSVRGYANRGGALAVESGTVDVHFSRFYQNTATSGPAINSTGTVSAGNNWWGTNTNPSAFTNGEVTVSPWLMLGATASPSPITTAGKSLVRANLTYNSAGSDTAAFGHVWNGTPVSFQVTGGSGSLAPAAGNTISGANSTRFTPSGSGTSTISATVDGQTVSALITVSPAKPVANFTAAPRSGPYPLTVRFTDLSKNAPTAWKWTFGDSSSVNSTVKSPVHTYARPGTYTVILNATNSAGSNSTTRKAYITVTAPTPVITGITPASGKQGALVTVTNLSGTNFRTGAKVFFNRTGTVNLTATNVTVLSTTRINCTVKIPAGTLIGPWSVTVKNPYGNPGTRANAFTVKTPLPPTVTGITPASAQRGRLVWITSLSGTGFVGTPKPKVQLLKNASVITATNVTVASGQQITCSFFLPAGAATGAWHVRVTNGDSQSGVKNGAFTVTG